MKFPFFSCLLLSRFNTAGTPWIPLASTQLAGIAEFNRECAEGKYSFEEVPCLCVSTHSYCVALSERYGIASPTVVCLHCGLPRTSPRLTDRSLGKFYTESYPKIYQYAAGQTEFFPEKRVEQRFQEQKYRGEQLCRMIRSQLPTDRKPVVFDVGCSTGGALLAFRDAGCDTYGCDLGSSMFARGRAEGLTLIDGDESVLQKHGPADFIILSHVLEHLPHPKQTLGNLRNLLNENGMLYIEVPGSLQFHLRPLGMMQFLQNAHLWNFTLGTLRDLAQSQGLAMIRGDQGIHAFFKKGESGSGTLPSRPVRAYLMLGYIFLTEILYRTGLLGVYIFVRKTVRRGIRNTVKDMIRSVRG